MNSSINSSKTSLLRETSNTSKYKALRAVLGDEGIIIKDQFQISQDIDGSSSSLGCMYFLTGNEQSINIQYIPYKRILTVRDVDISLTSSISSSSNNLPSSSSQSNETGIYKNLQNEEHLVEIVFVRENKDHLIPTSIILQIDTILNNNSNNNKIDIVDKIYSLAYKNTKPKKSILILINPNGGRGKGLDLFNSRSKPIFEAAECKVEIKETQYYKHAIEIVQNIDINNYDIIACASGDGIPYEVLNGLYKRKDRAEAFNKLAITQLPCGSGNAMSESCHGTGEISYATLSTIKAVEATIDLMAITQHNEVTISFLSQSIGVIASADVDTEHLAFLGPVRFDLGVAYGVFTRAKYPCDVYIKFATKSKDELRNHYHSNLNLPLVNQIKEENFQLKYNANTEIPSDWEQIDTDLTDNLGIFYTGKMPYVSKNTQFFPTALPNDGTLDLVMMDSRTSILKQVPILLSVDKGSHIHAPEIHYSKILAYRLIPKIKQNGSLSIDGERYDYDEYQCEVLPNTAKILLNDGSFAETNF
ncbi:hypothetical protein WICMUC_003018 [Wickerhamomyces mucosus]|uniref:sphingosine kinase n=1 Tax=Wickerhamomyces mucosus TaxID=1378264 RepID=A0A9P8PNL8_9ASCO|nr:hypothetical protein WICMUC_003018 [Wickerhamomyces mucosus]